MAQTIDARVKQKTGVAADFAGYTLLAGEIALVRTSASGPVWNFKVGPGNFDSLDWSLQNPGAAQKADTSTVFPTGVPGLYIPTEDGTYEGVTVDLSVGYTQLIWDGTTLVKAEFPIDLAGYATVDDSGSGKNKANPALINASLYWSNSSSDLLSNSSASFKAFVGIPVIEGLTYALSGIASYAGGGYLDGSNNPIANITLATVTGGRTFTVPTGLGIQRVAINVAKDGTDDGAVQLEEGSEPTSYEPFAVVQKLSGNLVPDYLANKSEVSPKVDKDYVIESVSYNRINPAEIDFERRYSPASTALVARGATLFAISGFIPVEEGKWYTLHTDANNPSGYQGGYFADPSDTAAIQSITMVVPVAGLGRCFQVPTGLGIVGVRVNIVCQGNPPNNSLLGNWQLEEGEMATPYQPYDPVDKIKPSLLPTTPPAPPSNFNAEVWYKFTDGVERTGLLWDKAPLFASHWLKRDKDLVVCNTGTSLTARTDEHCTDHPLANQRPPLMHSNNLASILWDKMRWDNQHYRRYDYPGFFTETGTFNTSSNLAEWDDGAYRRGLTRYAETAGAAIDIVVPADAWQFNFIYRTDSTGVEDVEISIDEGDNQMEVYDEGTSAWVEANGYQFSMRESTPVARNVTVPNPSTGGTSVVNIATKSNTTYQKRLKMRCKSGAVDSRSSVKNMTISASSSGRFMYWGVEWSPREFMISYINAARGSFNTQATSAQGLPRKADNEVWGFKPDLMLFELPIHNDGASNASSQAGGFWWRLTNNFVFNEAFELSMVARSQTLNGYVPELIMHTSSIAWNFGGIDDDGNLIAGQQGDGSMMTAQDKFHQAYEWVVENHPDAGFINSVRRWVDAGDAIFGNLRAATTGSGKNGNTFTNEGSHWNDSGSKIIAKTLTGLFEFV